MLYPTYMPSLSHIGGPHNVWDPPVCEWPDIYVGYTIYLLHTHTHKPKILAQQQKLLIGDSKAKKKIETNQPILPKTNNLAL